jgi:Fe-S cluster assembly protein SufD
MTTVTKNKVTDLFLENAPSFGSFPSLREESKHIINEKGLPAAKDEEYKFTAISKKLEQVLTDFAPAKPVAINKDGIKYHFWDGFEGSYLVFNNGIFSEELSAYENSGLVVKMLSDSNEIALGSVAKAEKDAFIALNTIYFEGGIHISVPRGKKVESPIMFLFLNQSNKGQIISPRILIEVAENAEATFLEHSISLDESVYFSNSVTEIKVGQNSHVHYNRLQNDGSKAVVVSNFETDIHRDATFTSTVVSLSGDMVRNNLSLRLLDSGCVGNMYGLYLLNGKTHVDNHTNVDHTKPHAESNELYKGILADQSRGVFNGKIFVRQDAQKTNAFQQNNNILLSEDAIVNTKPQLEIWADDVKCSHGCTTGQLDEEALFYLQARGIDKMQAKGLLLYAFAGEVLEHINDESFRNYIDVLVQKRLGSNF